nr:L,D-transpeptidase [uncultured Cetobacterium sp.]
MKKLISLLIIFFEIILFKINLNAAMIERELLYDKYTLTDTYTKNKKTKMIQWDKISQYLDSLEAFESEHIQYGSLGNYKNSKGGTPTPKKDFGIRWYQAIPLYTHDDLKVPYRYAKDGSLVAILAVGGKYTTVKLKEFDGIWLVPNRYVKISNVKEFDKVIFIDIKYQNLVSLEKVDTVWKVRSINPITSGLDKPPYQLPTPLGSFIVQSKKRQMWYLKDGSKTEIEGHSPYATRFSGGGYVHGIPINLPRTELIEYGWYLGTYPRSHMCVRSATSHAKFLYEWSEINKTLVINFK